MTRPDPILLSAAQTALADAADEEDDATATMEVGLALLTAWRSLPPAARPKAIAMMQKAALADASEQLRGAEVPAIEGGAKPEPVPPPPPPSLPRIGDKPPLEGWPRHR